jgi:hypothetical protein
MLICYSYYQLAGFFTSVGRTPFSVSLELCGRKMGKGRSVISNLFFLDKRHLALGNAKGAVSLWSSRIHNMEADEVSCKMTVKMTKPRKVMTTVFSDTHRAILVDFTSRAAATKTGHYQGMLTGLQWSVYCKRSGLLSK